MADSMILTNYRYNGVGGIDADRELDNGEIVPYTLTQAEINDLPGEALIWQLDTAAKHDEDVEAWKTAIDQAAGAARMRFVSQGQLVEEEYRLAKAQADAWDGQGEAPKAIYDWAASSGMTAEEAKQDILTTAQLWDGVLLAIRELRLAGKASVNATQEGDDVAAVAQPYIDQINLIKP